MRTKPAVNVSTVAASRNFRHATYRTDRAIYYWAKARDEIYMLTMYSKSEAENLDKKTLAQIAKQLGSIK